MKKKLLSLCVTVLLLAALLPLTVQTAFAQDYDRILSYQVDVTPNVNDGSLAIRLSFRWKALEDLPATNSQKGGVKIGIPNGSIRDMKAISDNIADIQNDNSYAYVDFTQGYKAGQEFDFSFSWVQEYMYTLNNGEVAYDYTPGWFDGTLIDEMTLTWHDPAGVTGVASEGDTQNGEHILTASSMGYGDKLPLTVTYADWPTALDSQYSRENIPEDYNNGSYYEGDRSLGDTIATVIGFIIMIAIICFVVSVLTSGRVSPKDVVKGYELGVNNYIKKPFLAEELDAHIGALLKMKRGMGAANESEIYRIGENYTFDAVHAVLKHSSCVQKTMTEREAKLLQMLCKKKNELVRRDIILSRLWDTEDDFFASRSLDVFVTRLRKLFADDERIQIKTVKGVGLCLSDKG